MNTGGGGLLPFCNKGVVEIWQEKREQTAEAEF